jgi:hypothetical protein
MSAAKLMTLYAYQERFQRLPTAFRNSEGFIQPSFNNILTLGAAEPRASARG